MREALFTVSSRPDGTLIAVCTALRVAISGMNREELQEEARDARIRAVGPAHVSYRVPPLDPTLDPPPLWQW